MKYLLILISLSCFGQEQVAKFSRIPVNKPKIEDSNSIVSPNFSERQYDCNGCKWMYNPKYKVLKVEFICGVIQIRTSFNHDPYAYVEDLEHNCKFNHASKRDINGFWVTTTADINISLKPNNK